MKKSLLAFALFFALSSLASAALLVTDSGVSSGTADNKILERRSAWDAAQTADWIVAWMKIPPGSHQAGGAVRYRYKVTITAPDKSAFNEGPFDFDSDGYARNFKPVAYFAGAKTTFSPKPCQGEWKFEFTLIDKTTGQEDLGALLPFYLSGSDPAQAPTDINEAKDKAVDETVDMTTLALFNTAKQFGAQQEQARQVAASTTITSTTLANPTTTTTIKKAPAKKKKKK
jgi:hypothetical protein